MSMRICFLTFALFAFLLQAGVVHAKYASIVIEANSGRILHQVNSNTRNYPASLTKMMTLFMVFEAIDDGRIKKTDKIKFSKYAAGRPPSKLGVGVGGRITIEQAISALVTKSANDVATAVAEHLGGTEAKFARRMTIRANALGMGRTKFRNASGLPNKGQLSTAKDMATLVQALQKHFPHHYHYFSMKRFNFRGRTYGNHNKLLGSYRGTDGVKTGYIRASGFNLAASVERGGVRLIGVVFGGKTGASRNAHMKTLLDKGFAKAKQGSHKFARAPLPPKAKKIAPAPERQVAKAEPTKEVIVPPAKAEAEANQSEDFSTYKVSGAGHLAPPLPKAYQQNGLSHILIKVSPTKISLVQDFKTGKANYDGGGWSVQVGAYKKLSGAEKFLLGILPSIDNAYEPVILSQVQKHGSIYKPRLVGMPKNAAFGLCKVLKAKKIDCLVISPNAG